MYYNLNETAKNTCERSKTQNLTHLFGPYLKGSEERAQQNAKLAAKTARNGLEIVTTKMPIGQGTKLTIRSQLIAIFTTRTRR